jgi:hypothetical protein
MPAVQEEEGPGAVPKARQGASREECYGQRVYVLPGVKKEKEVENGAEASVRRRIRQSTGATAGCAAFSALTRVIIKNTIMSCFSEAFR